MRGAGAELRGKGQSLIWIILLILVAVAVFAVSMYNGLVTSRNKCDEAFSTMDVYLKQRADLVPNLVNTVKGYAKHEAETLESVITARNAGNRTEQLEQENRLSGALRQVFALAESYPELRSNENFINLQNQLGKVETDIANSRKYYNGCVKAFNDACMTFPGNVFAGIFHFAPQSMFSTDEQSRTNVKVEF